MRALPVESVRKIFMKEFQPNYIVIGLIHPAKCRGGAAL